MEKNYRPYWDDIKKSFILYSLIPMLVIVLIGYLGIYLSFMHTLFRNNADSNRRISNEISAIAEQYTISVSEMVHLEELQIMLKQEAGVPKETIYETIYAQLQGMDLQPNCFIVDANGRILLSTTTLKPDYIRGETFSQVGIGQRMKEKPGSVVVERCAAQWGKTYSMCAGCAVRDAGEVIGFVILDLPGETLGQLLRENTSSTSVVTNRFGYLFAGEANDAMLSHNKLIEPLSKKIGKVRVDGRTQYVSSAQILDGQICVYTIMDISYLDKMFIHVGAFLFVVVSVFTALLVRGLRSFAHRKSKILDDMVLAVCNVGKGELTARLEVNSQDEFQIFAEEYNRMLTKLEELMQVNEEIVRHTVITEIKQLESQFNPHFLYNTLGTIKYMISLNQAGAYRMIDDLSEILRYTIRTTAAQARLEEDLQYTQHYLEIQKYRFEDALQYSLRIERETLDCLVPKLVIQPVIENAINYGFHSRTRLSIKICARMQEELLMLVIQNDGEGMTAERLEEVRNQLEQEQSTSKHIGLYNIHRRIQLLYGKNYGLRIESSPEEGTRVEISFPAIRGGAACSESS